jgi:uncharacterized protein
MKEENVLLGFVNFDKSSPQINTIEVLVLPDKVKYLKINRFVKVENNFDSNRFYIGRVVEGPYFQPEEVDRSSALAQISILHGENFPAPPDYFATYAVEIVGVWDNNMLVYSGTRPTPQSKIYSLSLDEINKILDLASGDLFIGNLDGYPDIKVKIDSNKISILPRNVGIFGTVGSGKTNSSQVLIEELCRKGWAVIVLDVEGEYTLMDQPNDMPNEVKTLKELNLKPEGIKNFFVAKLSGQEATAEKVSDVTIRIDQIDPAVLVELIEATEPQAAALMSIIYNIQNKKRPKEEVEDDDFLTPGKKESGYTLEDIIKAIDQSDPKDLNVGKSSLMPLKRKLATLKRTGAFDDKTASNIKPYDFMKSGYLTVFDLSVTGDYEKNLLTAQILSRIFAEKLRDKKNELPHTMIVIEEAHTFISRDNQSRMYETMRMLKEIARRGRKRWLALTFVSQQPSHIPGEIFELSNTRIIHNIRSAKNLEVLKVSSGDISEEIWNTVPTLDVGRALINGPQFRRHSPIVKFRFPLTKRRKNE